MSISKTILLIALAGCMCAEAQQTPKPAPQQQPGQASQPASPAQAQPGEQSAVAAPQELPPNAPVITLDGICENQQSTPAADCKTVVTKAEFEQLANALNPDMTEDVKRQLANSYGQVLLLARSAEQQKLGESPQAQQLLEFARLQGLAQVLVRKTQQQAEQVSPEQIQNYYKEHQANYEQTTMRRLFIPKFKVEDQGEKPVPLDKAAVDATSQKIKMAAEKGESFEALQKQAYDQLGIKTDPPAVDPVTLTRDQMPESHEAAWDLKPGQVSQVYEQPGGIYIYKVEGKKTQPLEEVKSQIQQTIAESRMQTMMLEVTHGATPQLNDQYFGEPKPGEMQGGPPQQ